MQNNETDKLLDDLESLSNELDHIHLDNLANLEPSLSELSYSKDIVIDEGSASEADLFDATTGQETVIKPSEINIVNLDTMIDTIVQQALPDLEKQLTEKLQLLGQDAITELYKHLDQPV